MLSGMTMDITIATNTFTLFQKLPTELRLKIWKLSFILRTVKIDLRLKDNENSHKLEFPVTLEVNRESRANAPPLWLPLPFESITSPFKLLLPAPILFNPEIGSVSLPFRNFFGFQNCDECKWFLYVDEELRGLWRNSTSGGGCLFPIRLLKDTFHHNKALSCMNNDLLNFKSVKTLVLRIRTPGHLST